MNNFKDFGLDDKVLQALEKIGYETPSPIQAKTIPHILAGKDVVGQAQTGTGKTAAFALPLLSRLQLTVMAPQVLVMVPTRELAIQVSEAFQRYAAGLRPFHVMPIYGGQDIRVQLRQLKRGVHVIVGTPGRVIDHMRRGTLDLSTLSSIVLDEGDEMLRMGFIDDIEWILEQTPKERQTSLFSATMPQAIRKIAKRHLRQPEEITIEVQTTTADTINHRYWMVSGLHKLDALTRILEAEEFDGMLIFVRTRSATTDLASRLEARGYSTDALNGEMQQKQRERTVENFKAKKLDILVATDVAARGLDVDRITHVVNYDIPYDTEAYVHRVGRTGRAGRKGEAILFVAPRERRMLHSIENATNQKIKMMDLPSTESINDQRINRFKQRISDTLAVEELGFYYQIIEQYRQEHNIPALEIASALAKMVQGEEPMLLTKDQLKSQTYNDAPRPRISRDRERPKGRSLPEAGMERYRIEVGATHGVKPGNIVGAIANETELNGEYIGQIEIFDDFSTVDLPEGMPRDIFRALKKIWVSGQQLRISRLEESDGKPHFKKTSKPKKNTGPKDFGPRKKRHKKF